ncbi:MAG TPA: hypothetical protein VMQ48_01490 [Candidatus Saccharimonadales bacterium]|nr:hypothetical protein [Candidatus Saccharimonadales bacterium]
MPKEKTYRYYVEHHDDHTNEVLARYLAPKYECDERELWTGRKCQAWEVPDRRFVNFLKSSKKSLGIEFDAFIQEDNYSLRPFPWPIPKRPMPRRKGFAM